MCFLKARFRSLRLCSLATGLILLLGTGTAHAISDRAATEQVSAQLVASVDRVHPGSEIYLGVHQKLFLIGIPTGLTLAIQACQQLLPGSCQMVQVQATSSGQFLAALTWAASPIMVIPIR